MKFVSKSAIYSVILKPSIPSEPLAGRAAQPGLSVRFEDGMATVTDENICKLLVENPYFNVDFFAIEEEQKDPFGNQRKEMEPAHSITELKYGTPVKTTSSPQPTKLSPELAAFVNKTIEVGIKDGITKLLPDLVEQVGKTMEAKAKKVTRKKKKKRTPAKKILKKIEIPQEEETPVVENNTEEIDV